ncbi:hypothetical protein [Bradyrhizobium rifense]|nr:hypothetical protein [Bradyrhizobium rifense]
MASSAAPIRRGFINEVAFAAFCQTANNNVGWPPGELTPEELVRAVSYVRSLPIRRETQGDIAADGGLAPEEIVDIDEQRRRLIWMFLFNKPAGSLLTEPTFPGCGMIDSCKGDLIASDALYEVKAGDRLFRSIDVRQLIVYGALNFIAKRFKIERLGLFNPRIGIGATMSADDLCFEISGKQSSELFSEIAAAFSSGEISR